MKSYNFFRRMVDELVDFSEHDPELADGIKWLDLQAQKKGITGEKIARENSTHIKHLHMAEEAFGGQMKKVEETLTDIRINVGRLAH